MRQSVSGNMWGDPILQVTVPLHGTFATEEDRAIIGRVTDELARDYGQPAASQGGWGGHQLMFRIPREVPQIAAYLRAHAVLDALGYGTASICVVQEADLRALKVASRLDNGKRVAMVPATAAAAAGTAGTEMAPGAVPLAPMEAGDTLGAGDWPAPPRQRRRKGAAGR